MIATPLQARGSYLVLLAALVASVLPHVPRLSPEILFLCFGTSLWWSWQLWRNGLPPVAPGWVRVVAVVLVVLSLPVHYGSMVGRNAGLALFSSLLFLKMLEFNRQRDPLLVAMLAFFLLMTHLVYSQTIAIVGYLLGTVLLLMMAILCLGQPGLFPWRALRLALVLMGQSLPVMVVLFLFFPRLPGPLWGSPADRFLSPGSSGFSDTMTPGEISQLVLSGKVAFRVRFEGPPPPPAQRYWRGLVLESFDGRSWHPATFSQPSVIPMEALGEGTHYEITLEPHQRRWLFALELPDAAPPSAQLSADAQLTADQTVTTLSHYALTSYLHHRLETELSPQMRRHALILPARGNQRSRALAQGWQAEGKQGIELVRTALTWFHHEPFFYTLNPPKLHGDTVDQFLFDTRRGFCEHFAGAFTFLMRAAGLPARVVVGYQGGEVNPVDGHLTIRQSDAHAWSEVWLVGEGWVRVDPTAAVAPERVEHGLSEALNAVDNAALPLLRPNNLFFWRLWQAWDTLDNRWDYWVMGFNDQRQLELFSNMGLEKATYQEMAAFLGGGVGIIFLLAALGMLRPGKGRKREPVQSYYLQFCRRLAAADVARFPWEGPLDLAQRASHRHPEQAAAIHEIIALYVALRYGETPPEGGAERLRQLVRKFTP